MNLRNWLKSALDRMFRREDVAAEMDEELREHIDLRADDLERRGMGRAEAERRARIEFGARERIREESVAAMGGFFPGLIWQDVKYAIRVLRKSPGFLLAGVLTLALAIGANAVVFSVMNAFVIQPLNVARPGSLYTLQHGKNTGSNQSYPDYLDLRDRNHAFDSVVAYNILQVGLDSGQNPTSVWMIAGSGNYFDALGLKPTLGRLFHAEDERGPNSAPYVVLTYSFWHTYFHDDRGVVGRVVRLNGHPFTILGVAPRDFHGTLLFFNPEVIVPLVEDPLLAGDDLNARGERWIFDVMGYLKPGVTPAQGAADLNSIGAYLEKTYPKEVGDRTFVLTRPSLYGDFLGKPVKAFMAGLMLLTGLILLAACANLGSLFAARAADRSKEVALRLALGSTRSRILRGLLTEAMMISVAGGAIGLVGSVALLRAMSTWQPFPEWPIHLAVNPDAKVYVVAAALALVSGLIFGAVPVRQVLQSSPYAVVKAGTGTSAGKRINARDVLLVVQIAICGVLVTSSLVAVRGLVRSLHAPFGFAVKNTMLAQTDLSMAGYSGERVPAMQKRMIEAMQALPGVDAAALADSLPLGTGSNKVSVFKDTTADLRPSNAAAEAAIFSVSPEYFRAAGTKLMAGREFTWNDDGSSPQVAVVNVEFARILFGSPANAMGRMFKRTGGARVEVVGIAEDGKYDSLTEDPRPAMFLPILQSPSTASNLVVRGKTGPEMLGPAMRSALRQLDAGLRCWWSRATNRWL
ncbi:MAG TPA: ABC transporter permease [Terracidiphilus sp.]|nr:ABC transporter permease [Terracidiphilus sp.]